MENESSLTIKEWSKEEQPREKAKRIGVSNLTNADLIALIIRTGIHGTNVIELAQAILRKADGELYNLSKMDESTFKEIKGMGDVKATQLAAIVELGRRIATSRRTEEKEIRSSQDVFTFIQDMAYLDHEEFWIILLNNSNRIIKIDKTFVGGLTNTPIDIRLVLKAALSNNATKIIVVHNHPTGSLSPSGHDNNVTKRLKEACTIIGISLLDHLIVGKTDSGKPNYYSYNEEGQIYDL